MAEAFQLKLTLRGVSPLVWRRLVLSSHMTLADLHKAMQIAMTWDGDFLHTFRIHGKAYSTTDQNAGESAAEVALQDLPLRFGERFVYKYNYFSNWQFDVRIEKAHVLKGKGYPKLTGGSGNSPPENVGGPARYMQWLEDQYSDENMEAIHTMTEMMQPVLGALVGDDDELLNKVVANLRGNRERFEDASSQLEGTIWINCRDYNQKAINQQLKAAFAVP